jgi:hypothetical protein
MALRAPRFRAEVRTRNKDRWRSDDRRFASWTDADAYVLDPGQRWTSVVDVRVTPEAYAARGWRLGRFLSWADISVRQCVR